MHGLKIEKLRFTLYYVYLTGLCLWIFLGLRLQIYL